MNILFGVLIGILVMTIVVTVHEFGHFIVAKRNGVNVKEFGIGFPPKAKTWLHIPTEKAEKYCKKFDFDEKRTEKILAKAKKKGKNKWIWIPLPKDEWYEETDEGLAPKNQDYLIFSINYLPIGGFCQMDGETNIDTRKGTFGAASLWSKTKILFAGVTMNWLLAFVILTVLAWTGMPQAIDNQYRIESDTYYDETSYLTVDTVFDDTPAAEAGIQSNDKIIEATADSIDYKKKITLFSDLIDFNNAFAGKTVTYTIERNNEQQTIDVDLNTKDEKYVLGISMWQTGVTKYHTTWSAPIIAAVNTVQMTGETFRGLGQLVVNLFSGITSQFSSDQNVKDEGKAKIEAAGDSVSGPVGIIGVLFPSIAQTGLTNILLFMAIISISLACMNVLPIPALDGGRWLLIFLYEKILRRKLTPETENKVVSRAFMALLALAVIITILDIMKIIK